MLVFREQGNQQTILTQNLMKQHTYTTQSERQTSASPHSWKKEETNGSRRSPTSVINPQASQIPSVPPADTPAGVL